MQCSPPGGRARDVRRRLPFPFGSVFGLHTHCDAWLDENDAANFNAGDHGIQDPRNAPKYQALGVNLYVALWKGPTADARFRDEVRDVADGCDIRPAKHGMVLGDTVPWPQ